MPVVALPNFAKGEISPTLYARVDTAMYKSALRKARNAIIHPYGGVSNRPGTLFIAPVKDHANSPRLFRFHLGVTDQYVLEFGNLYMRVIRNDALVLNTAKTITAITQANPIVITATAHGFSDEEDVFITGVVGMTELNDQIFRVANSTTNAFQLKSRISEDPVNSESFTAYTSGGTAADVFELTTPYTQANLSTLKMVQTGNVLTITHPSHAPRDLTRTDHNVWSLTALTFAPSLATPTSVAATASTNTNFQVFETRNQTVSYSVTAIADTDEFFEESLSSSTTLTDSSDPPLNTITWATVTDAQRYGVYRQDNGIFGLVGETESLTFTDDNLATDLTISPPRARDPFSGSGNFPDTSGYYQQRQVYGGSNNSPDTNFFSQTGLRLNMSVSNPLQADDAFTASLPSLDVQNIRHYVPLTDLLIFTNGGEWIANSGGDSRFSADTVKYEPQTFWGSTHQVPIIIGKSILFVEDGGGRIRAMGFSAADGSYTSADMNLLASHLLVEEGPDEFIVSDWTHQQFPEPRIYIVRSDGVLLTMTFNQEQEVIAWTTWDTGDTDNFESITSLRRSLSSVEDGVYFVIQRIVNGKTVRYIERLKSRKFAEVEDAYFVDAGVSIDSPITITDISTASPVVITAANHGLSNGDAITASNITWKIVFGSQGEFAFHSRRGIRSSKRLTRAEFISIEDLEQFNNKILLVMNVTTNQFQVVQAVVTPFKNDVIAAALPKQEPFFADGIRLYVDDDDAIKQTQSVPTWEADGVTGVTIETFSVASQMTGVQGIEFKTDGAKMFVMADTNTDFTIYEYKLSTPWNVSTASHTNVSLSPDPDLNIANNFTIGNSGSTLYIAGSDGSGNNVVFQYAFTTAWDLSTLSFDNKTFNVTSAVPGSVDPSGDIFFKPDGTRFYVTTQDRTIYQFDVATAWDISTSTYDGVFIDTTGDISGFANTEGIVFNGGDVDKPAGTIFFVSRASTVLQYSLSEAWDLSTAIYTGKRSAALSSADAEAISLNVINFTPLASINTYIEGGEARKLVDSVNLRHLEGETVCVLADGNVTCDLTVKDGKVAFGAAGRVQAGKGYVTDIETLNIESPSGTVQDKLKKITSVMTRFYKSRLPFIGPNEKDLVEMKQRDQEKYGEPTTLLTGDKTINIPPSWNTNGRLWYKLIDPVPMTILGIFPDITLEDDLN